MRRQFRLPVQRTRKMKTGAIPATEAIRVTVAIPVIVVIPVTVAIRAIANEAR